MRILKAGLAAMALAACGPTGATGDADAQPATKATPDAAVTNVDRAAILRANNLTADARGMVENECGEKVAPKYLPADLGGAVGTAIVFVMEGGPNTASCYGDGADLHVMKREGAVFREIHGLRGGVLIIVPQTTQGVKNIIDGGPGFSHPLWAWNGRDYADTGRKVADGQYSEGAIYLP